METLHRVSESCLVLFVFVTSRVSIRARACPWPSSISIRVIEAYPIQKCVQGLRVGFRQGEGCFYVKTLPGPVFHRIEQHENFARLVTVSSGTASYMPPHRSKPLCSRVVPPGGICCRGCQVSMSGMGPVFHSRAPVFAWRCCAWRCCPARN